MSYEFSKSNGDFFLERRKYNVMLSLIPVVAVCLRVKGMPSMYIQLQFEGQNI
jgi:hypothetical protein